MTRDDSQKERQASECFGLAGQLLDSEELMIEQAIGQPEAVSPKEVAFAELQCKFNWQ